MTFDGTLVVLDLETTGLPSAVRKERITECALIAVHSSIILDSDPTHLPRVMDKFVKTFNPLKAISRSIEDLTGFTNDKLKYQKHFDVKAAKSISRFLEDLAPPICLLAHYGKFGLDFGLLQAEVKMHGLELPEGLLCVDTWEMFKCMDGVRLPPPGITNFQGNLNTRATFLNGRPRRSYRLQDLFTEITGVENAAHKKHTAEGDCITLMRIVQQDPRSVLNWITCHARLLDEIPPKYVGRPNEDFTLSNFPY